MKRLIQKIEFWLMLIWFLLFCLFLRSCKMEDKIQNESKVFRSEIASHFDKMEREFQTTQQDFHQIFKQMDFTNEKVIIIQKEHGKYIISIQEKGEHENQGKGSKTD